VLVAVKSLAAELAASGVGIALIARTALLQHPELRILEPGGYRPMGGALSLVTPSARTSAPKVRAFADAIKAFVATRPDVFT
jgi:DNA-binding transcriptional LysR family regulator